MLQQTASMLYTHKGTEYLLNLIDTPVILNKYLYEDHQVIIHIKRVMLILPMKFLDHYLRARVVYWLLMLHKVS